MTDKVKVMGSDKSTLAIFYFMTFGDNRIAHIDSFKNHCNHQMLVSHIKSVLEISDIE